MRRCPWEGACWRHPPAVSCQNSLVLVHKFRGRVVRSMAQKTVRCQLLPPRRLQSAAEMGDDIRADALGSKVALLALHFPRLRIIWSRSLHATASIFRELKANQDEPDPLAAASIGDPSDGCRPGSGGVPRGAIRACRPCCDRQACVRADACVE